MVSAVRKPTGKVVCVDCGKKRDPFWPIIKQLDDSVWWACRQCFRDKEYSEFMWQKDRLPADQQW